MPFERRTPRINKFAVAVTVSVILFGTCVRGEGEKNPYDDYLRHSEAALDFDGSVLVTRSDSILLAEGYGLANRESSSPNTAETTFLLCSVTKPFTALAVLQLVEAGKLSWDDPISKFLPDYSGTSADRITIYHLLTHTSGLADYLSLVDSNETFTQAVDQDHLVSLFMSAPLEFEPNSQWQYSNSNYYVLGKIIEAVSGLSYGAYMEQQIFSPSGMHNSGLPAGYLNDRPGSATGYRSSKNGTVEVIPPVHSSWPYAAGGLYSTILDLAKWDKALRNQTLLSDKFKGTMYTPNKWRYACGWEIDTLFGLAVASHGGTGGGYCSITIRLIDQPLCVAVLSNDESSFRQVSKIAHELLGIALGKPAEDHKLEEIHQVAPKLLDEYAGDYELAPGIVLTFIHRDGRLFTHGPGQPEVEVYPRSDTEFFLKVVEGSVQFMRDSTGIVSGILVQQGGKDMPASRVR